MRSSLSSKQNWVPFQTLGVGGRDSGRCIPNSPSQQDQSSLRPGICYNRHKDSGRPFEPWRQKRACRTREKENLAWDRDLGGVARAAAGARATLCFLLPGHNTISAVREDAGPTADRPLGRGTSAKRLPGLWAHRDVGDPFCTTLSPYRDFKQLPVQRPKTSPRLGLSPCSLRTITEATLSPPTSCQSDQSEPSPLRRPAPSFFSVC